MTLVEALTSINGYSKEEINRVIPKEILKSRNPKVKDYSESNTEIYDKCVALLKAYDRGATLLATIGKGNEEEIEKAQKDLEVTFCYLTEA